MEVAQDSVTSNLNNTSHLETSSVVQQPINTVETTQSVREDIKQNTVEVNTSKPEDTINDLLARFGVQG